MPYLGASPQVGLVTKLNDINSGFNGVTTTFQLAIPPGGVTNYFTPGSVYALFVQLGGVTQNPGVDYTVSGSQITFTTAPAAGLSCFIIAIGQAINVGVPADGSVGQPKLGTITSLPLTGATSGTTTLIAPAVAGNNTISFPASNGSAYQALRNGATPGQLEFYTPSAGVTRTTFTSSGTWTKPSSGTIARVTLWGGGGGGGTGAPGAGGGGGGACVFRWFNLSDLPSTVSVTIGAGGAAGNPGTTGGTSSFGSLFSAYGGSGGTQSVAGAGGGALSAGSGTTAGTGYGAINTGAAAGASADCSGGGGANGGAVGKSTFGGGGGGSSGTAGGVSLSGGAGGTGWVSGVGGTAGTVPAGGGGSGWPGAAGLCYIDVW